MPILSRAQLKSGFDLGVTEESKRETLQEQCYDRPFDATIIDHSTLDPTGNNVVMESVLCDHITTFSVQQGFNQFSANAGSISRLKPRNTGGVFGQFTFNKPTDVTFRLSSLASNEFIQFRSTDLQPFDGTAPWDTQAGNIIVGSNRVHNNNGNSTVTFLGVQEVNVFFSNTNSNNTLSSNYQLEITSTNKSTVRTYTDDNGECELVASNACDCTNLDVVTEAEVDNWIPVACIESKFVETLCYEEPQIGEDEPFNGVDYSDDNTATSISGVTSEITLTAPLSLSSGLGQSSSSPTIDYVQITTNTTNVDGNVVITFDQTLDVTLVVERLNGNEIVNFITPISSFTLGDG